MSLHLVRASKTAHLTLFVKATPRAPWF